MTLERIHRTASIALFVALITASSYITLPGLQIPFTAQSIFVMIAGLMLGSTLAASSVLIWLLLGIFGLPVFAQGGAGFAILLSPRGGYLIGYIFMAYLSGCCRYMTFPMRIPSIVKVGLRTIILLPAMLSVYLIALPWLRWQIGAVAITNEASEISWITWQRTLLIGFWPFVITDIIKTIIVAFTYESVLKGNNQKSQTES
ncbi:biotin transporter BioY [Entomospira entomophila]|uniref:Biotin transporter n=1 Tax=Entomospira entomophila TaxID=2719988 RepID=A0A968GBY7_9SPIO|nr:biotin transporter BioY [Entomospira entomophilus]NIZ40571.1 biotin transporter BioY [Entomospira entomophilus]WDI36129.1 biotin transporter BioY [Entomospira entomophilus]